MRENIYALAQLQIVPQPTGCLGTVDTTDIDTRYNNTEKYGLNELFVSENRKIKIKIKNSILNLSHEIRNISLSFHTQIISLFDILMMILVTVAPISSYSATPPFSFVSISLQSII